MLFLSYNEWPWQKNKVGFQVVWMSISWDQEPPESPPLVGPGVELANKRFHAYKWSSISHCLFVSRGGGKKIFYKKRGWRYKKVGNHCFSIQNTELYSNFLQNNFFKKMISLKTVLRIGAGAKKMFWGNSKFHNKTPCKNYYIIEYFVCFKKKNR